MSSDTNAPIMPVSSICMKPRYWFVRSLIASFEEKMSALDRLKAVTSVLPVGLVRSAFFGALSKHFGIPASELEAALKSKNPQTVRAVEKPIKVEPPPRDLEAYYAACVLRDRRLLDKDEDR